MRRWLCVLAAAALGFAATPASAALPTPARSDLDFYSTYTPTEPEGDGAQPLDWWNEDLKHAVRSHQPDWAADHLARRYDVAPSQMRELVTLWLVAKTVDDFGHRLGANRPQSVDDRREMQELRARLATVVAATGHAPLALQVAASALGNVDGCDAASFQAMTSGTATPAALGWDLARTADCYAWYAAFEALAPRQSAAALIAIEQHRSLAASEDLSLLGWLISEAGLAHVEVADRPATQVSLLRDYLGALLDAGLSERAVQSFDALPAGVRAQVLDGALPARTIAVDGLPVSLRAQSDDDDLKLDLVAAYALDGRRSEAEGVLASAHSLSVQKAYLSCTFAAAHPASPRETPKCGDSLRMGMQALVVDRWLQTPGEDPYPIAETFLSDPEHTFARAGTGVRTEVVCRLFSEPEYAPICEQSRRSTVDIDRDSEGESVKADADAAGAVVEAA